MRRRKRRSLAELTAASGLSAQRVVSQQDDAVVLGENAVRASTALFRDQSVLLSSKNQLAAVLGLLRLDGIAKRVLLCPPDLSPAYLPAVITQAAVTLIACDGTGPAAHPGPVPSLPVVTLSPGLFPAVTADHGASDTEWLLFTSGTTGQPKIVVHTLASLTGPLNDGLVVANDAVWSTFYDIRRYGGLQILLRALLGGGSMVLSQADEPISDFLVRVGKSGVTHISGTPSHWRRALMSPAVTRIDPRYVRLSGELADQAILDRLATAFPKADIAHAFASTEAGVAFDVRDRQAGFPAAWVGQAGQRAEMRVQDGSLRLRSSRVASRYLGDSYRLTDEDGFVDTGDMIELRNDRYYFVGRREGIINVGGQKVYPEEIEAVINRHPAVQMSRARSRHNPITGSIVVADILPRGTSDQRPFETIKQEILEACRLTLAPYKVPALLYEVNSLDISEAGKLARRNA